MSETQQTQVTENQDSTNQDSISKAGGETPVSFDEFEAIEKSERAAKRIAAKEKVESEQAEKEIKKESKTDKKEIKKAEKQAKTDEKGGENETEGQLPKTQAQDKAEDQEVIEEIKKIVATHNDSRFEVPATAEIQVKIDGEDQTATVQDLINSFSGHKAVERRFTELRDQKNVFLKDKRAIDSALTQINSLANTDPDSELRQLATLAGIDGEKFLVETKTKIADELEKMASMSPEERKAYEANAEADRYRKQLEYERNQMKKQQENLELQKKIQDVQSQHSIDDDTFDTVAEELLNLQKAGKIQQKVTPELVANVIIDDRRYDLAREVIKEVNPGLASKEHIVESLVNMQRQKPETTKEELLEEIQSTYGVNQRAQNLSKKVSKQQLEKTTAPEINPQNQDVWSFDQL